MPLLPSNRVWDVLAHSSNTMKSVPSGHAAISLTRSCQEFKDVEEKLGDLIPWLMKLKESVATARPGDNSEDAERTEQLTRFASRTRDLADSS